MKIKKINLIYIFRFSPLIAFVFNTVSFGVIAENNVDMHVAKNVVFDPIFLKMSDINSIDLSLYANGAGVSPGTYPVQLIVNNQPISTLDVEFREATDKTIYPCMSDALLRQIPFRDEQLPKGFYQKAKLCTDISHLLPDTVVVYDSNEQKLKIQIPQVYVNHNARGSINSSLWDSGIPAAILGYNLNGYKSSSNGYDYKSLYAGVNAGLNIGAWYLRHNGSYNWQENGRKKYDSINTYLQRDISVLHARALIGESNTRGDIFDTLPFSGFAIATDERMLPSSQRGYAPDIRGIAKTNAKVTVRQSGKVIYQTSVSPGQFLINDLYPTGYGGDLFVTVEEADGSYNSFTVPYASVVEQLRPGAYRYEIVGGNLRYDEFSQDVALYQGTIRYGISNYLTGYGGIQASQHYYALLGGMATGTEMGAFSFDVTQARMHLPDKELTASSGQSYRLSYSKYVEQTGSNISVAAYRFSSSGYLDFITAQRMRKALEHGYNEDSVWKSRNRFSISASQSLLEGWGQLYVSGSMQDYWNKNGTDKQYQMGYNNNYQSFSWGLSTGRTYSTNGTETTYLLTLSMPLGQDNNLYRPQLNLQMNHDSNGRTGEQATISGTAGSARQLSYSITAMNANQGAGTSGAMNVQYRTNYAGLSTSVSGGRNYHSESFGATGSLVAHSGGLTFSPYISDTFALVEAKGAEGAMVSSYPGINIDPFGYALVPYLEPYQMNGITIDPKGTADDVELKSTEKKVAPYFGAIVKVKYNTKLGTPVLINASLSGDPVPFGADVIDHKGRSVGTVGQAGQIYARVEQDHGKLTVRWGKGRKNSCEIGYHLMPVTKMQKSNALQTFTTSCQQQRSTSQPSTTLIAMSRNVSPR
ncbi:fimbrial biogenesis outer membrane usher protein [Klebsiella aerogenes]|uniref:fimbria/pilus outer membrane usher protein n=1 Tax=Klebsiella aerogenes TaxID=548 RepID=UPI002DB7140F|nr:fimbria/pilus outer membrane usher protein [Klebsiella aerogenes]MEB5742663.1 fimbrial biogenesis outer membrane usher protein [Klebsiella aerogenes]